MSNLECDEKEQRRRPKQQRACVDCPVDITERHPTAIRCVACQTYKRNAEAREKQREARKNTAYVAKQRAANRRSYYRYHEVRKAKMRECNNMRYRTDPIYRERQKMHSLVQYQRLKAEKAEVK